MSKARKSHRVKGNRVAVPPLKSTSGSGFSFEDKVTALFFVEMLAAKSSLGTEWRVTERIERQAADWEPFGDLLLTIANRNGELAKCGCSIKSNRQITGNGCSTDLRSGLWSLLVRPVFNRSTDMLGMFCAELASDVSQLLNQFCKQAREEEDAGRLDAKISHAKHRKIFDSFRNPADANDSGLPRHVLTHLIPREFDFEDVASRSEASAIALCRDILRSDDATNEECQELWEALLGIAKELRDVGGSVTRERLATKLRHKFNLKDDPSDTAAWAHIRKLSQGWMEQTEISLPGNLILPRSHETSDLCEKLAKSSAIHVIGESGCGKSALIKARAIGVSTIGGETVWIRSDQFSEILRVVPDFADVLRRTRRTSALLVFDSLEACYDKDILEAIGRVLQAVAGDEGGIWKAVLICQTPDWLRVVRMLVKTAPGHRALSQRVECGDLSGDDVALVGKHSASIRRLMLQGHLQRVLRSVKMLDVLLSGQLAENRSLAGEADLVEWWWNEQVRGGKQFASEESIVRLLGMQMANALVTEVSPDIVTGPADAVDALIHNRVLRRTQDGRLRFDHDLLADWSRVMHLRSLGEDVYDFMLHHTENPPWSRAIRLLSQHLLERVADLERWRTVVKSCSITENAGDEPAAQNLQVLDAWLEGIAYCGEATKVLDSLKADLFANEGWLLIRLVRRLLHVGTLPDPVILQRMRQFDVISDDTVGLLYRLPNQILWTPVLDFLVANKTESIDCLPVELAEVASMWARLEEYFHVAWPMLADVVLLNAERELRREVAGVFRHNRSRRMFDTNKSRTAIYTAALQAASQFPDRAAKLVLKAAGRAPWEEGDVSETANEHWRGEWHDHSPFGGGDVHVIEPPESWPDGPNRRTSDDFFHAWMKSNAALALYRHRADAACEATLAFSIDWPKSEIRRGAHGSGVDHHGFTFDANHMYPAFWTKGNFIMFLRENWRPALGLIVRLVNFATDRYEDWWPYEDRVTEVVIRVSNGAAHWKGNRQVYAWHRYHMNTAQVVTCALMALEKWFDEQLEAKYPITEAVQLLYDQGRSLAFAGVLVSIGKRHPDLFLDELKPLLFVRSLYIHDVSAVRECLGSGYSPANPRVINDLTRKWNQLPGRRTHLKEACCAWLLGKPRLEAVLGEVSNAWRREAEKLPPDSEERLAALRWAADFDRSLWKEVTSPDGRKGWMCQRPPELQDIEEEERIRRIQHLIALPHQCSDFLEQGQELDDEQLESVWRQLQNWAPFEQLGEMPREKEDASEIRDHRHARAGLLAVLLCAGDTWLDKNPGRREWVGVEVRKILADPPKSNCYGPDEIYDDYEGLLARAVVRGWAHSPDDENWRGYVASFVTAYRYRTILRLFQEAFRVRQKLGKAYRQLEGLALAFAAARRKATRLQLFRTRAKTDSEELQKWGNKWLSRFARGKGPNWTDNWSGIEVLEAFPHARRSQADRFQAPEELHRRDYGLDMGIILAAFGQFPPLTEATDATERAHWFGVGREMVAGFCRTLPSADKTADGEAEWHYDHWSADEEVFKIVARRVFECTPAERRELWSPIVSSPFAAHHHICYLLDQLLIESLRIEPYRITEFVPIWHEIAEHIFTAPAPPKGHWRAQIDVQKHILLYGSVASTNEEFWKPLVEDLRPWFKKHLDMIANDAHDQSSFARFLVTKAGECLLVDAMIWLQPAWELASHWFWKTIVEDNAFSELLEYGWRHEFARIRANPGALKAFKTLTLKLAAHHVPIAMEVQQNIR
jgi:hypothetical protein